MDTARKLDRPERQWRVAATLGLPLAMVAAPLLVRFTELRLCVFRSATGLPCPLCGGTRACAALVEGDFLAAMQFNPGLMPLLALALVHGTQLGYEALTGRRVGAPWRIGARPWVFVGVFLLTAWIARLLGWV